MRSNDIQISVIIPTYNMGETLVKTLESLGKSDFDLNKFEVIVIDDGSVDNTKNLVSNFKKNCGFELVYRIRDRAKGYGPGIARNEGLPLAKGRIIAFTDADCIVDKSWLSEIRNAIINQGFTIICGTITCTDTLIFPWKVAPAGLFGVTANMAVDKDTAGLPYCDEQMHGHGGNDTDFVLRFEKRGFPLQIVKEIQVQHPPTRFTLRTLIDRILDRKNEVYMHKVHGGRYEVAMHPLFRPILLGRISPATAFSMLSVVILVALFIQSWQLGLLVLVGVLLVFCFAFLFSLYKFTIMYVPAGEEAKVSFSDRFRTLFFLFIYFPFFLWSRIQGSIRFKHFML